MSTNLKRKLKPSRMIAIAGLVLALLFAVVVIFLAYDSSEKVEDAVIEKMEVSLLGHAHSIDLVVDSHHSVLRSIANHLEDEGGLSHMDHMMSWIEDIVRAGDFYRISITDVETDKVYFADPSGTGITFMGADDEYYHKTVKKSVVWNINGPYKIEGTDIYTVIITVPVLENGRPVAVVAGMIELDDFMELILTEGRDSNHSVYLVDSTGHIFVGTDKDENVQIGGQLAEGKQDDINLVSRVENHAKVLMGSSLEEFKLDIMNGKSGYMIFQADTYRNFGKGYMVYEPLEYENWTLVYTKNRAAVIEEFDDIQREGRMTIAAVIALFAVIMISTFLAYKHMYNILKASNADLKQAAETDYLTGLYSRGSMIDNIKSQLENRSDESHVLLLIDIDKFKQINDTLGHDAGDKALVDFANCMKAFFRKEDYIGRFGGDEFFVFLPGVKSVDGVVSRLGSFGHLVTEKTENKEWDILGCSIGMAVYPQDGETYEKLYREADVAMYESKKIDGICKFTKFSDVD